VGSRQQQQLQSGPHGQQVVMVTMSGQPGIASMAHGVAIGLALPPQAQQQQQQFPQVQVQQPSQLQIQQLHQLHQQLHLQVSENVRE
jgi:hypothetical protein